MENNPNNSRVGLELGTAPTDGTEKSWVKTSLNFGRNAADIQYEKLKTIIGAEDPNLAVVIVFKPCPGKHQEFEEILRRLLDGSDESDLFRELSGLFQGGMASYNIINSGVNLVLHVRPGPAIADMITEQINMVLGLGVEELAGSEQAQVNLNLVSGIDFHDLLDFHTKGYTTMAAFWQSTLIELTVKSLAGSKLDEKLIGLVKNFVPFISGTPLPLLPLLKTVDVDFSFRSVDELPASIKKEFNDDPGAVQFPRVPKYEKEGKECKLFERITEVLQADIQAYITLEKVAAINIDIRVPGFGVALTTPQLDKL